MARQLEAKGDSEILRRLHETKRGLIKEQLTAGTAINDQHRLLERRIAQLEKEEDRRKFTDNSITQVAKEQAYKRRYDAFEDRRDKAISRHYE